MNRSIPDLCDDHPDAIEVLTPMFTSFGGRQAFRGEIVTIKCHEDNSLVKSQAAEPGTGKVMVIDGGGSLRRALLGDQIAANAVKNGWEGIIIYGCARDVEILENLDIGVLALAAIPMKTEKRGIGDLNVTVEFGGVRLHPGHHIYVDKNGVIVSSASLDQTC